MADNRNIFRTIRGNACVRHCACCKTDENVEWSWLDNCYLCDDCFDDLTYAPKDLENENESPSSTSKAR